MRVGLLCGRHLPALDGVADYTARLAVGLADVGVEPVLLGAAGGAGRVLCRRWDLGGVLQAAGALRRADLDVLHVQWSPSGYGFRGAVGLLPLLVDLPVVTTVHEYGWWAWPRLPPAVWERLEARGWDREGLALLSRSRAVLVTNAAFALRTGPVPQLVPIGPNVPVTAPPVEREEGLLVFFGFVHPVKGVRYLLEAMAGLPGTRLVVAGGFTSLALPEGEATAFRAELEQLVTELGLDDRVRLTGHLPAEQVSALLRRAAVVVLPLTAGVTTRNGALLAALAHGAPVLATAPDEPDPALVDGRHLLLVPVRRDQLALRAGLQRLLGDGGLRARLGAAGAELAREHSWSRIAADHRRVYEQVLA